MRHPGTVVPLIWMLITGHMLMFSRLPTSTMLRVLACLNTLISNRNKQQLAPMGTLSCETSSCCHYSSVSNFYFYSKSWICEKARKNHIRNLNRTCHTWFCSLWCKILTNLFKLHTIHGHWMIYSVVHYSNPIPCVFGGQRAAVKFAQLVI